MSNDTKAPTDIQQINSPQSRGSGCYFVSILMSGCLIVPVIVAFIIFLGIVTGVTTFTGAINSIVSGFTGIFQVQPATATVVSSPPIVNSIRPLGQLVSLSAQLAKADINVSIRQGFQNACGYSASHVAQGAIEAGIDLTSLTADDVSYDEATGAFTVLLSPAQLTSCRIDYIRQYDRSYTTCRVDWDNLRLLAQYEGLLGFRDDAIEGGMLVQAEQEAQSVLSNFLQLATGQRVNIAFKTPDPDQPARLPSSCNPPVPQGWTFSEEDGRWSR